MIQKKIRITDLTDWFVNIIEERSTEVEGEVVTLKPHAVSYQNSLSGREALQAGQPEHIANVVLQMWGDVATVEEPNENDNN